jgi:CubicO group peptidase (beta-lactamase class C family)
VLLAGSLRDDAVAVRVQGTADGQPLQPATRFNIASLGKMFTAVAVGQLVDAGRLRFDDPLGRHLPALPGAFHALTVGQLLSHTAGLGSYLEEHPLATVDAAPDATALLPLLTAQPPQEVGRWRYSNTSFALAAVLVEAVSGLPYERYLRERILGPARMTATSLAPRPGDALPTVREADGTLRHPPVGRMRGGPAGGAFAPAGDLLRFARALFDGTLLSPATAERMTSLQHEIGPRRADGVPRGWGFGFGVSALGRERLFGHVGGIPGAAAALRVRVADGRVVVALAHQDRVPPGAWSARLLDMPLAACAPAASGG